MIITDEMVHAAAEVVWGEVRRPYAAYCRDFTNEQVLAGELWAADRVAERKNMELIRRALQAALEAIPEASL